MWNNIYICSMKKRCGDARDIKGNARDTSGASPHPPVRATTVCFR